MKKLLLLLAAGNLLYSANAQIQGPTHYTDKGLSRLVIDLNTGLGNCYQKIAPANFAADYYHAANAAIGNVFSKSGSGVSADMQIGYFWGAKQHFGIGIGVMYTQQQYGLGLDNFHVEYQSTDANGNTFRQLITATGPVSESVTIASTSIPLVLKYKTDLSRSVGFSCDAGLLYNIRMIGSYQANAAFNYEAVYKTEMTADGASYVYESAPAAPAGDQLYTAGQYTTTNPKGNVNNYFDSLNKKGYNVGLNVSPKNNSGTVTYTGSLGFIVRPQLSFYLKSNLMWNVGAYLSCQTFNNTVNDSYMLTNKVGSYNSLLNTLVSGANISYGMTTGFRYFLGKHPYKNHRYQRCK